MTGKNAYVSPRLATDGPRLLDIWKQAFGVSDTYWQAYCAYIGEDNFRGWRGETGALDAAMVFYRFGQWFGGREVPCAGIAAVGIAADERGRGVGTRLLESAVRELHEDGVALSALYPATHTFYRKFGYELGGHRAVHEVPIASLPRRKTALRLRRIELKAEGELVRLDRLRAAAGNGLLARNHGIWERLLKPRGTELVYAYLIEGREGPARGYVIFEHAQDEGRQQLKVRDHVTLDAEAGHALWDFLAGHATVAVDVRLPGPLSDPLHALLPEKTARLSLHQTWFLRIVDVPRALAGRGYAAGLDAELHLDVTDPLLAANTGRFVLRVEGGAASVERGGRGDLRLGIDGLAPLYTGLHTAAELARIGLVDGEAPALARATALFAGPQPWTPDFF